MRILQGLSPAISILFLLTGCGQYLGAYSVDVVRVAADVPLKTETSAHYGQFLEVSVSSETSITDLAEEIDGLYLDADFCPLQDRNGVIVFGPFSDGGESLSVPSTNSPLRPGPTAGFTIDSTSRSPIAVNQPHSPARCRYRHTTSGKMGAIFASGFSPLDTTS